MGGWQVNQVLAQLRLSHVADLFIGRLVRLGKYSDILLCGSPDTGGISGGERRRATIGIELVTRLGGTFCDAGVLNTDRPSLLLLDEPVSGACIFFFVLAMTSGLKQDSTATAPPCLFAFCATFLAPVGFPYDVSIVALFSYGQVAPAS